MTPAATPARDLDVAPALPSDGHGRRDPHDAAFAAMTWGWLSALFARPPSATALAAHRVGPLAALLAELATDPVLAPSIVEIRAAIADDDEAAARRVAIAHGRLFDGIGGPETVPLHESAHVGDGRLFGPAVTDMERLLAAHDLSVGGEAHEPADHLAIELALMARLAASDHPDRTVLAARLAGWVPRFADACEVHDRCGFHAAAARLLATLIEREASGLPLA